MDTPKDPEKSIQPPPEEQKKLERQLEAQTGELINANEHLKQGIAERKRIEEHLRQLEKAVEMMQLGVIITDLDGKIIYTNRADVQDVRILRSTRLTGLSPYTQPAYPYNVT